MCSNFPSRKAAVFFDLLTHRKNIRLTGARSRSACTGLILHRLSAIGYLLGQSQTWVLESVVSPNCAVSRPKISACFTSSATKFNNNALLNRRVHLSLRHGAVNGKPALENRTDLLPSTLHPHPKRITRHVTRFAWEALKSRVRLIFDLPSYYCGVYFRPRFFHEKTLASS